jgi:CRP-like cAMP-binding protein
MLEILKKIPFFAQLDEASLNQIAEKVKMDYFPPEHVIFKQGDPGEIMFVIKRGQVQVIRDTTILAVLKDGDFFGEMALVSEDLRNATIKTVTDVEVMTLAKEDFIRLIETNGEIASTVSYEVVKRANSVF